MLSRSITTKGKTLAVIGLGYVGLPLAVEFGKIRKVIGFDVNTARIDELTLGVDRTFEVAPEDLMSTSNLLFTSNQDKLIEADIFIVTVPTPIDDAKRPDMSSLRQACQTVGCSLNPGNFVIIESTVYPGATEEVCGPILEEFSGLGVIKSDEEDYEKGFYLGYSPERIDPGNKERRLPSIIKVTSGSTMLSAAAIDELYREIIVVGTHKASSIKVAEAAKVIENTQRDLNIAFVNELSMIFDRMNINTEEVLQAATTKWNFLDFKPGLVGGHCIGVDPYYLVHKANMVGHHTRIINAGRRVNDEMAAYVAGRIAKKIIRQGLSLSGAKLGVLGVTFKPNCPDIRNTKVVDLVLELESWGCDCIVWDPLVDKQFSKTELNLALVDIDELTNLDAIVIAVQHDAIMAFDDYELKKRLRPECSECVFRI
jgi:UDP-N-acetyl-D-galactosamine dehydrogenase